MLRLILWRLAQMPLILAIIYVIAFMLAWVAPGEPFTQSDRALSNNAKAALRERFHAQSWQSFLLHYPARVILHGDFGPSMSDDAFDVNDKLAAGLPVSMSLGLLALAIAVPAGVLVGTLAATRRGTSLDFASNTVALVGISLPSFVTASLLLLLYYWLRRQTQTEMDWANDLAFPALTLSLLPMAYIARLMRVSMLDVLSADFVRTARAKGLPRWRVIWKHCARSAVLPVISFLAPAAAATLTGSFVVESVFNTPGIGQDVVQSVLNRDQTLMLAIVLIYSTLLILLNLLSDVVHALLDPRIELARGNA